MITPLLAALALQTQAAPNAADVILQTTDSCLAVMQGEADARSERIALDDGREASIILGRDGCSLDIDGWRDDQGTTAARVRDALTAAPHWQTTQWREQQVNEAGPGLWTSVVFPDIRRHSAYFVQIIEPVQGAPQRLSVSYGIGR